MTNDETFRAISEQRRQLLSTLESMSDAEWNTQSLCAGWKTRDVVGHLLSILEIPTSTFVLNAVKARNFNRYADLVAREIGANEPAQLVARYRACVDARFAPPIVGPIAPLTDVLVHTRDLERPIGRASRLRPDALRTALDYACGGKARGFIPAKRTKGLRFVATDLDWSVGQGAEVLGTGEAILLAVTGRRAVLPDLQGAGASTLSDRLG